MSQPLDALYTGLPEPKHVWITSAESRDLGAGVDADAVWDDFVAAHPNGHILQTARWAQLKSAFGWTTQRAELRTIPSPDAPTPGGRQHPLPPPAVGSAVGVRAEGSGGGLGRADQARAVITMARAFGRRRTPPCSRSSRSCPTRLKCRPGWRPTGFTRSPQRVQPLSTIHLDLAADEETILSRMKPKWRYNVRLAERKGVTVRAREPSPICPPSNACSRSPASATASACTAQTYYPQRRLCLPLRRPSFAFVRFGPMTWLLAEARGRDAGGDRGLRPGHARPGTCGARPARAVAT